MFRQEDVKISFYNIKKCGFYKRSEDAPLFSSIDDVLAQLQKWTSNVDLSKTKVSDATEENGYPIYLLDIFKGQSEWVFATWNEVPASETGVASVSSTSKVGMPEVHMNEIAPNSIPGYATYFWVIPERNLIATLQFQHKVNGQKQMQHYFNIFMANYMSYAVVDLDSEDEYRVIGYTDPNDNEMKSNVRPYFKTAAFVKSGPVKFIIDNYLSIKKVVRRGHVNVQSVIDRTHWQSFISFIRGSATQSQQTLVDQSLYMEIEYKPELDELKKMIDSESENYRADYWDDIGFKFEGNSTKIHWVNKAGAYGDVTLNVDRLDEEVVNLESLLKALHANRKQIEEFLKDDS